MGEFIEKYKDVELKPCPFCGYTPMLFENDDPPYGRGVHCLVPDCCTSDPDTWNTRPIEDALQKRIGELEKMVEELKSELIKGL